MQEKQEGWSSKAIECEIPIGIMVTQKNSIFEFTHEKVNLKFQVGQSNIVVKCVSSPPLCDTLQETFAFQKSSAFTSPNALLGKRKLDDSHKELTIQKTIAGEAFIPSVESLICMVDCFFPIPQEMKVKMADIAGLTIDKLTDPSFKAIKDNLESNTILGFLLACKQDPLPKLPKPLQYEIISHFSEPPVPSSVQSNVQKYCTWATKMAEEGKKQKTGHTK